jgi:hypothetical protein
MMEAFWLLVRDKRDRLVWVGSSGLTGYSEDEVKSRTPFDETKIAPDRSYADTDLALVVGV